ncbi:MAG: META domain-containing protein [Aestuariivirga sp.]|uniref:META domain-containing protein n=1 Tax=Aestuariivirga sp. TaxID=2650926 RepID=UPI0025BC3A15|nr:META domain-containing protein [Aestuariivirga sp.]MCA3559811.1 META domain-containing protein [Aestuariivirga sp.]
MRQLLAVSGLILALLAEPALAHQEKLAGADWVLAGQTGQRAPFLRFEAGRVAGLGGCNRFGAGYELKGGRLSFSPISATRMACAGRMEAEQAFFAMLGKVKAMKLDGDTLQLLDGEGKVLAAFARRVAE